MHKMKRVIICSLIVFLLSIIPVSTSYADNGSTIVHVTRTGSKYHKAGCSYLKSDISMTLADAVNNGYTRCSRCNPPVYDSTPRSSSPKLSETFTYDDNQTTRINNSAKTNSSNAYPATSTAAGSGTNTWLLVGVIGAIAFSFYAIHRKTSLKESASAKIVSGNQTQSIDIVDRERYYKMYAGKDPLSLVEVPEGTFLKYGYPSTAGEGMAIYGKYTVYVGENSKVFHLNPNCGGNRLTPMNYYLAWNFKHCPDCASGKIQLPTLKWYFEYREIERIKKDFKIP